MNPMGMIWVFLIFRVVTPVLLTTLIIEGKFSVYNTFIHKSILQKCSFVLRYYIKLDLNYQLLFDSIM